MFQLRHSGNLAMLVITIVQIVYAFGTLFIACELCQRLTLAFNDCSEMIDQTNWYLLPVGIQRMLPLITSFAQPPVLKSCALEVHHVIVRHLNM